MKRGDENERPLIRYLLGELSEAEQSELEERLFAGKELLEQLAAVEYDLIDEYVRGELAPHEREQFERTFLASPGRRQRVEFARSVLKTISEVAAEKRAGVNGARQDSAPWWRFRQSSPALPFALAAMVLAGVGIGTWLTVERRQLQTQLAELQAEHRRWQQQEQTMGQEETRGREREEELTKQLHREQSERARLEQELAIQPASRPTLLSFVLSSVARDPSEAKKLVIPPGISSVQLQLDLEEGDDYKKYKAVLRTVDGHEVLSRDALPPRGASWGRGVFLRLPADTLALGDYELQLRGVAAPGELEDVGYYYFSVVKK